MKNCNKILIVEDETIIAIDLQFEFESNGYTTLEPVATGEKAIEIIQKECPNFVLLDIRLAGKLTGLDVAHFCYKHKNPVVIIFMTGYVTSAIKKEALSLKPLGFFEKPVDIDEIVDLIERTG